ncbi:alpha-glucosidase [Luteipulveratus sp. YIM 133132]|uniref:alpha-glucosidase n=1 Tax=Luteipulveratus flavus TaxID=3031728 RepID=UPI0023AED49A|nr:alpha-glucosidase [Luteipulveratus sp. YIM 133132]MDE9365330.1 alpha-glucosidase [Luteipulveratus sp. YIM 133132]
MTDTPDRPRRRLRRAVLLTVPTVLVVAVAAVAVLWARLPEDQLDVVRPGRLEVQKAAQGSYPVGVLTVVVDARGVRVDAPGRAVWQSAPGRAFVTGARGSVSWEDHRGYFWPDVAIDGRVGNQSVQSVETGGSAVRLRGRLSGNGREAAYEMTVSERAGGAVLDVRVTDGGVDAVGLVSGRSGGAAVHGFGEQFSGFDLDGRLLPVVVREQGVGRGVQPLSALANLTNHGAAGTDQTTYAATSTFVTDDLRGLRLDPSTPESHAFAVADLRTRDEIGLNVWSNRVRAQVSAGADPLDLVGQQAAGEMRPPLASWVNGGAVVGLQGGTAAVRREVDALRRSGAKISAVWLQDWTGQRRTSFGDRLWWTWQPDRKRYPDWDRLVSDLAAQGIRTTTYVNPWLVDAKPKGDNGIRNLWEEARQRGYLVKNAGGQPYQLDQGGFDAALVDLTNPAARAWYADVIATQVLTRGVDGFMADFGEGLPYDARLAAGDAATEHNRWPLLWAQTVQDACRRAGKPQCVTWFRSGSLGMSGHTPMFWTGDQLVDYSAQDGLASALHGTLAAGVSGWPLVHSDIGGYTSVNAKVRDYTRPSDLNARWAEYAAFGTMMRTHETNRPADNKQVYDQDQRAAFARMTRLYAALAPYRAGVVQEATITGVPAIRHSWLVYPGTLAARSDDQFFLGGSLLVAPVLKGGATSVRVVLPPGRWVHLLTGKTYDGDRALMVPAPVGTPAAFVQADDPALPGLRSAVQRAGLTSTG